MMKRFVWLAVLCAGCAHVDTSSGTFSQRPGAPMVLTLERHMDTIVNGPDIDEDQTLTIELRRVEVGKKIVIPSEDATARFLVKRFGPGSTGKTFQGFIIVKSVKKDEVLATMKLLVTAATADGTYTQKARIHGDFSFVRELKRD
jgi:hypothetical protein